MKQIHIHGKIFDNNDFAGLVIGGQTNADTIRFVVPRVYAGEVDFSDGWSWFITFENKEGDGDTVALEATPSSQSDNIHLDWKPGQTATQVAGKLTCQVFAQKGNSEDGTLQRFACAPFSVYVSPWLSPEPITQAQPSVIEQALELMAQYNADVQNAIQAGKDAAVSAAKAEDSALISERYAKGTEDGEKVTSGEGYQDNALYYSGLAFESAEAAASSEGAAELAQDLAKAYAIGKTGENNEDVAEDHEAYHNNSKYWSDQAAGIYGKLESDLAEALGKIDTQENTSIQNVAARETEALGAIDTAKGTAIDDIEAAGDELNLGLVEDLNNTAADLQTQLNQTITQMQDLKTQMDANIATMQGIVQKQVVAPITIEGKLYGWSLETRGGEPWLHISDIETSTSSDEGGTE